MKTVSSLNSEILFTKSQVYIERGLSSKESKQNEEYQLWASLAIELLAKSSLSHVHPALVADPTHFQSLFAACGRPVSPDIKTITAKTLYERLSVLIPHFDQRSQKFCEQLALRRNAELHSGESPFLGMKISAWEGQFWYAVELLLNFQDKDLDTWLGAKQAKVTAKILKEAQNALSLVVKEKIAHAKSDFSKIAKDEKTKKAIIQDSINIPSMRFFENFSFELDSISRYTCPSCSSSGALGGELIDEEIENSRDQEDPFTEYVTQTFSSEEFLCLKCALHLKGQRELSEVGIEETFTHQTERERDFEAEYGND